LEEVEVDSVDSVDVLEDSEISNATGADDYGFIKPHVAPIDEM